MSFLLQPWHLLLLSVTGWVNRQQQDVIAYLRTKNQILRENHGIEPAPDGQCSTSWKSFSRPTGT